MKLYLVTKSRARVGLLKNLGFDIQVIEVVVPEDVVSSPSETVISNSLKKYRASGEVDGVKAAFDTVIFVDNMIIGKPKDEDDARNILKLLSGNFHEVYSGYVVGIGEKFEVGYDVTRVYFRKLSKEDIDWYISKGEYIGAAGGYRIQDYGKLLIERIEGDFYNVVGLPLIKFIVSLGKLGINYREII